MISNARNKLFIFPSPVLYTHCVVCNMQQIYYIHNVFLLFWAIMEFIRGLNY